MLRGQALGRWNGGLGEALFATYGRSSKKPTVGRTCDLPWVVEAIYRRLYFGRYRAHQIEEGRYSPKVYTFVKLVS